METSRIKLGNRALQFVCAGIGALLISTTSLRAQPGEPPPPPPGERAPDNARPQRERDRDHWPDKSRPNVDRQTDDRRNDRGPDDWGRGDGPRRGPGHRDRGMGGPPMDAPGKGEGQMNGPGRGPGGDPEVIPWNQIPEPEKHQIERFMEEHVPRIYMELQKLKDRNEERYNRRMTHVAPEMRRIIEVMRADPQRGELMLRERKVQVEIRVTAMQYHRATDEAAKQQLKTRLVDLCTQAFDCQTQRRQMEVMDLQAKLSELRSRVTEAAGMKDSLIQARVNELIERNPKRRPSALNRAEGPDGEDSPVPQRGPQSSPD